MEAGAGHAGELVLTRCIYIRRGEEEKMDSCTCIMTIGLAGREELHGFSWRRTSGTERLAFSEIYPQRYPCVLLFIWFPRYPHGALEERCCRSFSLNLTRRSHTC